MKRKERVGSGKGQEQKINAQRDTTEGLRIAEIIIIIIRLASIWSHKETHINSIIFSKIVPWSFKESFL